MKIEFRAVSKKYGGTRALDRASFEIAPGQLVAVLGANGAGKTTLLRTMSGIVAPDSGMVQLNDQPFHRDRMDLRKKLAFLPDMPVVFWEMSVLRHIGMMLRVYEMEKPGVEEKIVQLLKDFDLLPLAEMPLHTLSRGQLYKAALVSLIAVGPELWLLDEPFSSGMDPHGISMLKKYIREATHNGATVIYSTQILEIAERFSDRVCILHKGEVRAYDSAVTLQAMAAGQSSGLDMIFAQLRQEEA
ncbi:MAG: ABC transporter ATP-binding protein [Verrucomicrobiales bacterium]